MKGIVIDADYLSNRAGEPVVRLYCKKIGTSDEGKNFIAHIKGFEPYFYVNSGSDEKENIEEMLKEYVKRIEIVEKYLPIGYQTKKTEMLRVVLYNPKNTPECRRICEEKYSIFEADILFKNRFLIDMDISGMSVIMFDEIGKELKNYGLNCGELYIVDKNEIKLTTDKINIEY